MALVGGSDSQRTESWRSDSWTRDSGRRDSRRNDPWRSDTWRSVAQRSDTSSASERSDSWRSGICNNSRRTSRQACFGQRHHTMAPVSSHQTAQQIKPNHPSDQTTAAVQSSWVLPPSPPLLTPGVLFTTATATVGLLSGSKPFEEGQHTSGRFFEKPQCLLLKRKLVV